MQQDIYFPQRPSLQSIESTYEASSFLLLAGIIIFSVVVLIALISLTVIIIRIRKASAQQKGITMEMEMFYRKQLKLLHGKAFIVSFYQYSKLLTQLGKGKDLHTIRHSLGYDNHTIKLLEEAINQGKQLDYEQEKHIKDILHKHIEQ